MVTKQRRQTPVLTSELHKSFTPLFSSEFDGAAKQILSAILSKKLHGVDRAVIDRSFLTGEDFTVADACLFTVLGWASHVALDITGLAQVQRFLKIVAQRAAVRKAMQVEGLVAAAA